MAKRTLEDLQPEGKKVLTRVDFNVPLDKTDGEILDDTRIRAALPTINWLLDRNAAVILMSHLGRPKGVDPSLSIRCVAERLQQLLPGVTVNFVEESVGPLAEAAAAALKPGQILLLENLRFHKGEEDNDPEFAKQLASLADMYVNDAFGTAHRAHASTEGVPRLLPSALGLLMQKEVSIMGKAMEHPERPFVAVIGGAKASDKIGFIANLITLADALMIGGGMANTFLLAQGYAVGDSLAEPDRVDDAKELIAQAEREGVKLLLPTDVVIADAFSATANTQTVSVNNVPAGWRILDIGPQSAIAYANEVAQACTIVWNGPMGVFEFKPFSQGTFTVAHAVADATTGGATSIVGGGESVAAIDQAGLADKISHISTGGGASLEFLEGRVLPGVAVIPEK